MKMTLCFDVDFHQLEIRHVLGSFYNLLRGNLYKQASMSLSPTGTHLLQILQIER